MPVAADTFINWPGVEAVHEVIEDWSVEPEGFIGARYLPLEIDKYLNSPMTITWDVLGPSFGMTRPHVLNARPTIIEFKTLRTYSQRTKYWKEKHVFGEGDLLNLRNLGREDRTRMAERLLMEQLNLLDDRLQTRLEWLRWQVLTTGKIQVTFQNIKIDVDYGIPTGNKINVNTASGYSVYWTDYANADPVGDLQEALFFTRGKGIGKVDVIFNKRVSQMLSHNAIMRDLVKQSPLVTRIGMGSISGLLGELMGLPNVTFIEYDEGYLDESTDTFTTFIPDNLVILVGYGKRASYGRLGEFASTPSLHNGGISGARGGVIYVVDDKQNDPDVPYYGVTYGIYGMPVVMHPDWIIILQVAA